jgi:hypothetical protein
MSKSISPMLFLMPEAKPFRASPRSHRSDEFAVGYSLAVCSPALPASASPAGIHLQTAGSYLSTVSFGKISKLDSKVRTRQNINVRGGPNQSIEVGQTGVSNSHRDDYERPGWGLPTKKLWRSAEPEVKLPSRATADIDVLFALCRGGERTWADPTAGQRPGYRASPAHARPC